MDDTSKRQLADNSESDSDDDYGPAQVPLGDDAQQKQDAPVNKKRRKLMHQKLFIDNLPSATQYEKSYMHRDFVTHVAAARATDFLITGSCDGHVKFWKKMLDGVEFVKHFVAHLGPIHALVVSPDGQKLVTTSEDRMVKFFEVTCFDMSNMISLPYVPDAACWLSSHYRSSHGGSAVAGGIYTRVAIADKGGCLIRIYKTDGGDSEPIQEVTLHSAPVKCMDLNVPMGVVVSADARGMLEYWSCDSLTFPDPLTTPDIRFRYKTETDLYDLAKVKVVPSSVCVAATGSLFCVTGMDKKIRVFDFLTGKLKRTYNESSKVYDGKGNIALAQLSEHDLGRRLATERELEGDLAALERCNAVFDESGNFLGTPKVDMQMLLARQSGAAKSQTSDELLSQVKPDPTAYCTAYKRRRFYSISQRQPDESQEARDVLNEKPTEEERVSVSVATSSALGSEAIIHTTMGDIHIKLFANECPKTVENFCTHSRNGYYDNIKFHRVIKGFMIQTGDPLGDGTGGESIWGGEFQDEFVRNLRYADALKYISMIDVDRHDRPFTVSMANAGPNTNGSQFFITTAPTPWLDNKHTVFGRVTKGLEVVTAIENLKVDKYDRPCEVEVKMLNVDIKR